MISTSTFICVILFFITMKYLEWDNNNLNNYKKQLIKKYYPKEE